MSEFNEWFKSLNEVGRTTYFLGQEGNISKEAWDFQQAKIDELQARVDELQKHSLMLREAAKSWSYNEGEKNILISQADDLDRILKGNKDEN